MSIPVDRAKTLKAAFRACDVGQLVGKDIQRYYVDLSKVRNSKSIKSVSTKLDFIEPGEFSTILFTGHRGCGKSTELRRIQHEWESQYRVIYLEADAELDILDAEYTDLYLVIIKKVADELSKLELKFDRKLLKNFESWFKEVTQETEETVEKSVSLDASIEGGFEIPFISKLLAKLLAQIKGSDKQKTTIRQTIQRDIARLKTDINLLLSDAFHKINKKYSQYSKGLLMVFDNLDRVPPHVGNHLFFDYAAQLQELNCTIIYTAPISVVYSEKNLSNAFDSPNIVSMVNIYEFNRNNCDLQCNQEGLEAIANLIEHRVDVDAVFEDRQLLLNLAKASGGHVRQLMQMTASSCLTAATSGNNKVTADDVIYAIKQEQFNFERIIPTDHYPELAQVCLEKDVRKDELGRTMMFNLSVFEYNGSSRWNYINPVIKESDAFQKALHAAQAAGSNT